MSLPAVTTQPLASVPQNEHNVILTQPLGNVVDNPHEDMPMLNEEEQYQNVQQTLPTTVYQDPNVLPAGPPDVGYWTCYYCCDALLDCLRCVYIIKWCNGGGGNGYCNCGGCCSCDGCCEGDGCCAGDGCCTGDVAGNGGGDCDCGGCDCDCGGCDCSGCDCAGCVCSGF